MAESHVVSGLVAKRSELSGLIAHYQDEIRRIAADLAHVDGAIKIFEPDFDLRTVRPKAHRQSNPYFEQGEIPRMVLDILRTSNGEPMSTRDVGERMLHAKGIARDDVENWDAVLKPILSALKRLTTAGSVVMVGRVSRPGRAMMLWKLA